MVSGRAEHQIDEKGRIRIPAKFKKEIGDNPFIMCGDNHSLIIFSKENAESQVFDYFKKNHFTDQKTADALREVMENSEFFEEDKQGRILLSENLIKHALIKKNIVSIGMVNRVEMWAEEVLMEQKKKMNKTEALAILHERQ